MCNGFVGTYCRRNDRAAIRIPDKISTDGDDDKAAVRTADTKTSTSGDHKAAVRTADKIPTGGDHKAAVRTADKIPTGGDHKAAVYSVGRLLLRPVCIFAHGKTLLLRPTLPNMSRCNHFFAAVMNPLFLIFLLVRPALSSFKGLRVRESRFCCYRRFYDD